MTILFIVTALLLLASGVTKLHACARVGLGLPLLALLEIVAGLCLCAVSFAGAFTPGQGLAVVVGAVVLVLVSSLTMWGTLRAQHRTRELSEGARLRTYVKYLSSSLEPDGDLREPGKQDP